MSVPLKMDIEMMQTVRKTLTAGLYKDLRDRIISMGDYITFDVLEALYIIYQYQTETGIDNIKDRISGHTYPYEHRYGDEDMMDKNLKLLLDIRNDLYINYINRFQMPRSKEELELRRDEQQKMSDLYKKEAEEKEKLRIENERIQRERRNKEFEELRPVFYKMDREREERERIEKERKERESRAREREREIRWRNMQRAPSGYDQVMYYYLTKDL